MRIAIGVQVNVQRTEKGKLGRGEISDKSRGVPRVIPKQSIKIGYNVERRQIGGVGKEEKHAREKINQDNQQKMKSCERLLQKRSEVIKKEYWRINYECITSNKKGRRKKINGSVS